jgi:hypothetical protein
MALLIKKTGLLKSDGTEIPIGQGLNDGIFVKFIYQSEFEGYNQRFFLNYYSSFESKENEFATISILVPTDEGNVSLDTKFVKELDEASIQYYEGIVDNILANQPCYIKTIFAYHLFIKLWLENILGQNTVEIRLDLQ